ncbi:hypothetical protein BHECKSOX_593, partial [Bathymodiolus heckerae thiotrophic gill symbiont]
RFVRKTAVTVVKRAPIISVIKNAAGGLMPIREREKPNLMLVF